MSFRFCLREEGRLYGAHLRCGRGGSLRREGGVESCFDSLSMRITEDKKGCDIPPSTVCFRRMGRCTAFLCCSAGLRQEEAAYNSGSQKRCGPDRLSWIVIYRESLWKECPARPVSDCMIMSWRQSGQGGQRTPYACWMAIFLTRRSCLPPSNPALKNSSRILPAVLLSMNLPGRTRTLASLC